MADDYTDIGNPYNVQLTRNQDGLDVQVGGGSVDESMTQQQQAALAQVGGNTAASSTMAGGSSQQASVASGGAMSDITITSSIQSSNWAPKTVGFFINGQTGYAEFANVYIKGSIAAGSLDIPDANTLNSFHVNTAGDTWWGTTVALFNISNDNAPAYILKSGVAKFQSVTIVGGVIDGTSTIGGRTASTISTAIDSSGHFADNAINTASSSILGSFTFGVSGALQIGTYSPGVSGDLKISPSGILARNSSGSTTFSINGTTGVAVLSGLVVGTNVGLGTAQDSSGVTTIINGTVTTGFVNALSITAGSIAAANIQAGTITGMTIVGSTLATASSGQRVVLSTTLASYYDSSGNLSVQTYGSNSINSASFLIKGQQSTSSIYLDTGVNGVVGFLTNGSLAMYIDGLHAQIVPASTNNMDIGTSSLSFKDIWNVGTHHYYVYNTHQPVVWWGQCSGTSIITGNDPGFTLTHPSTGKYTITYNRNIGTNYAVVATAIKGSGLGALSAKVESFSATTVNITIFNDSGTSTDSDFMYVLTLGT